MPTPRTRRWAILLLAQRLTDVQTGGGPASWPPAPALGLGALAWRRRSAVA